MIAHMAFTTVVLGLTLLNYYVGRKNVLYPAFLFSLIWLVVFCLYTLPMIEVDELGIDTLAVVVSGVAAFSVGGAVVGRSRNARSVAVSRPTNPMAKRVLFFCCLTVLPIFFLEIRRLGAVGGLDSLMISARAAIIEAVSNGEKAYSSPFYTAAPMLAIFTAFVFLIEAGDSRKERAWVWLSVLIALAMSVLTTGRTFVLQLAVGLVGIRLLRSRRASVGQAWKYVRYPLIGFLALISILVPLDKDLSNFSGGVTDVLMNFVVEYTVEPLAGFNYVIHHPSEYEYDPNQTFREVMPALARISGSAQMPSAMPDDFVLVPLPTNVFTVFKSYYVDFGFVGMLVAMFLLGAGQTWLFRKALAGVDFYIFVFAISLYPLMMAAFDNQYSLISYYTVALIFGALYFFVLRGTSQGARVNPSIPSER
jgi:oligosaccharide repeat unit polymerase